MHFDVESLLTETIIFKQSPAPKNDGKPTHQPDRAHKPSDEEEEDLAAEQIKLMKGRKHSRGREWKEYEGITARQERAEKGDRYKITRLYGTVR